MCQGGLALHRTRSDRVASKPIEHMRGTQHHVNKHSEAHIWIEFRVKQPTLTPVGQTAHTLEANKWTTQCSLNSDSKFQSIQTYREPPKYVYADQAGYQPYAACRTYNIHDNNLIDACNLYMKNEVKRHETDQEEPN